MIGQAIQARYQVSRRLAGGPSGDLYIAHDGESGAEVTIKGFHAKDPSQKAGMLRELITSDGKSYGLFGSQQGPGAQ